MTQSKLTPGRLVELLAETDDRLAYWRTLVGHPYRQLYIDAYLARRHALSRKLAQRTKRPEPVPA